MNKMVLLKKLSFSTRGFSDIIDITDEVQNIIAESSIAEGLVTVSVPGSTAGITTIEYEPGLIQDLKDAFEKLAPSNKSYAHDRAWNDGNGFSHVRSALLGSSKSIPISGGQLILGTWQQIVLIDFDNRSRQRKVVVQIIGE